METVMKKMIGKVCSLMLVLTIIFAFSACGGEDYSYWQITARENDGARLISVAEMSFSSSSKDITEVWLNVSDLKCSETSVDVYLYKTSSTVGKKISYTLSQDQIKKASKGWLNIYFGDAITTTKVVVNARDTMRINELVVFSKDGEIAPLSLSQGGIKVSNSDINANMYTEEELKNLDKNNQAYSEYPAFNICDEPEKFPIDLRKTPKAE